MSSPAEKLAQSLEKLKEIQETGKVAIKGTDLSKLHRRRLSANGFLMEVMRGWYLPTRPDETRGESTTWYTLFWGFCADYLRSRMDDEWCLSPEQSLRLHVGNLTVPDQLIVRSPRAISA